MATTNTNNIARDDYPTYEVLEGIFLEANKDSHYAKQELKWLFAQGIGAIADERNRVTRSELEKAVEKMRSLEDRSLEDFVRELGFEVSDA